MRKKTGWVLIIGAIILSACAPQAITEIVSEVPQIEAPAALVLDDSPAAIETLEEAAPVMNAPALMVDQVSLPRDFEVKLYQGQESYGNDAVLLSTVFMAGKPVVVNYFAGLCSLCRKELPELQMMYEQYGDRVNFVLVDIGPYVGLGSEQDGIALLTNLGVTIPAGSLSDGDVLRTYQVFGTPALQFFLPDGSLQFQRGGLLSAAQIEEQILGLLQ